MIKVKTHEEYKEMNGPQSYSYLLEIKKEVDSYISNNSGIDFLNKNDYKREVLFQLSLLNDLIFEIRKMRYGEKELQEESRELAHELELKIALHPTAFCEGIKQSLEERAKMEEIRQEQLRLAQEKSDRQRIQKGNIRKFV